MGTNPGWFFDLGLELEHQGKFEEALASYDKALKLNPGFVEALNNRGVVLEAMNRPEEALTSYDRVLALNPDLITVIRNRGNVMNALGRTDEALTDYDRALARWTLTTPMPSTAAAMS